MKPTKFCLLLLSGVSLLACGQPGPLYLPAEEPVVKTQPKSDATPPATQKTQETQEKPATGKTQ